jgi:hypothetical protein
MMPANCLLVRSVQQAVHFAVAVVKQLNLPHSELISGAVLRPLGYLFDGLRRKLQVIVVVHEPGHVIPSRIGLASQLCSGGHGLSITSRRGP